MSAIRLAAVLGSLVVLAILLSPISPFTFNPDNPLTAPDDVADEPIDEAKIAPVEVTAEDFAECNSANDGIQSMVAGAGKNETYKIAADLLLGEYCNRPELVHEISVTSNPGLTLVSFACDAATGLKGDSALRDSLADHTLIYCESSRTAIEGELESLEGAVEGFKLDFLTELEAANAEAGSEVYDLEPINADLETIRTLLAGSRSLLSTGQHQDAALALQGASATFDSMLQSVESE